VRRTARFSHAGEPVLGCLPMRGRRLGKLVGARGFEPPTPSPPERYGCPCKCNAFGPLAASPWVNSWVKRASSFVRDLYRLPVSLPYPALQDLVSTAQCPPGGPAVRRESAGRPRHQLERRWRGAGRFVRFRTTIQIVQVCKAIRHIFAPPRARRHLPLQPRVSSKGTISGWPQPNRSARRASE
jgi:hypothetical protein